LASVPFAPVSPRGPSQEVRITPETVNNDNSLIRFFILGLLVKISYCNLHISSVIIITVDMLFVIYKIDRYGSCR